MPAFALMRGILRRGIVFGLCAGAVVAAGSLATQAPARAADDEKAIAAAPSGCPGLDGNMPAGTYLMSWDGNGHGKCAAVPLAISPSGMLGLGGASPVAQLTIRSPYGEGATSIQLSTPGANTANQTTLNLETSGNGKSFLGTDDMTQGWMISAHGDKAWGVNAGQLGMSFWNGEAWTNALTVTPDGLVGVDTNAPAAALDVNGEIMIDGARQTLTSDSADTANALRDLKPCFVNAQGKPAPADAQAQPPQPTAPPANQPANQPPGADGNSAADATSNNVQIQVLTKTGKNKFACVDIAATALAPPVCNGVREFLQYDGKSFTCAKLW